jgi:glycine/D-amino acid oxidase-like deaminating enzyme
MDSLNRNRADPVEYETDVVIVGFGSAGGCAAIEARDQGAEVVVLEKQPEESHYSNTRMSGGGFHSPDPPTSLGSSGPAMRRRTPHSCADSIRRSRP